MKRSYNSIENGRIFNLVVFYIFHFLKGFHGLMHWDITLSLYPHSSLALCIMLKVLQVFGRVCFFQMLCIKQVGYLKFHPQLLI